MIVAESRDFVAMDMGVRWCISLLLILLGEMVDIVVFRVDDDGPAGREDIVVGVQVVGFEG